MRLLIACRAIDNVAGGVERQATSLINEMISRGHTVSLLTWDMDGAQSFYEIDKNANWYQLNIGNPKQKTSWSMRLKRMSRVRDIMREAKPDVILAFQQGMFISLRLYTAGMGIPVIAAERESPYRYDFIKSGKIKHVIFQSFRLAKNITVQCASYVNAYPAYLRACITVIPNPIIQREEFASPSGLDATEKTLLFVGRLSFAKNLPALFEAFSKISSDFPNWKLVIAGNGEDLAEIKDKIKQQKLEDKVTLLGAVKDVASLYKSAHALCIPSRWEGFPNVLGESLAHGLPAVGYQGCGGVRDLITDGHNGLLAEGNGDAQTLANALKTIMSDDAMRTIMGKNAIESVKIYDPKKIYDLWENFLTSVANK